MRSVPGLNAVHVINGLRINDKQNPDGSPKLPRVRLSKIPGWNSRANMDDKRGQFVGRPLRENFIRTQLEGKPFTYEGVIEATDQEELEEYLGEINFAFGTSDELVINVEAFYSDDVYFYRGRITAFDPPEEPPASIHQIYPFSRSFTLGIYMADPRKYLLTPEVIDTGTLPGGLLGGAGVLLPFTPPVTLPVSPVNVPPPTNTDPSTISVVNDGSAPTDPIIELTGLSGAPVVFRNESIGTRQFALGVIGTGSLLQIDFFNRTVTLDGNDKGQAINDQITDWWDAGVPGLKPQTNFLRLVSGATLLRARFWHAFF